MNLQIPENINPVDVAKRVMFLAYNACGPADGMGIFQARNNVTEEDVWDNVVTSGDYPGEPRHKGVKENSGEVYADYVFGRMMKLGCQWDGQNMVVLDSTPKQDYQEWCRKYPTYEELFTTAVEQIKGETP